MKLKSLSITGISLLSSVSIMNAPEVKAADLTVVGIKCPPNQISYSHNPAKCELVAAGSATSVRTAYGNRIMLVGHVIKSFERNGANFWGFVQKDIYPESRNENNSRIWSDLSQNLAPIPQRVKNSIDPILFLPAYSEALGKPDKLNLNYVPQKGDRICVQPYFWKTERYNAQITDDYYSNDYPGALGAGAYKYTIDDFKYPNLNIKLPPGEQTESGSSGSAIRQGSCEDNGDVIGAHIADRKFEKNTSLFLPVREYILSSTKKFNLWSLTAQNFGRDKH